MQTQNCQSMKSTRRL